MRYVPDKSGNSPVVVVGSEYSFTTDPVVGRWTLLSKHSSIRRTLSIQNQSAGTLSITSVPRNTSAPVDGALPANQWFKSIPAAPAGYKFDTVPAGDIYVSSSAASSLLTYEDD